jgi:UDP-N-acetylglucosamine 2-epimerase (non-hydrolysing)/GDP/UDP-N,N'-diacetylbacillosamine 2-epimerase (hydrolysing)
MSKRRIAVFTGNRAEYGLQLPILRALRSNTAVECLLVVSGAHLDANFGSTLDEINNDGFLVSAEVKIEMSADHVNSTPLAIGSGIVAITKALSELKPDVFIVYADRFESLAAMIAATQMNIPTAHIEGGDLTDGGALDDSVRHAMTKFAHLHFTTNDEATNRIIAMGEESWRVVTAGFPAIDLIAEGNFASPREIQEVLDVNPELPLVVFTQHSVTTESHLVNHQISESVAAIRQLAEAGVQVLITYPNNDVGADKIIEQITALKSEKLANIFVIKSLGRYLYHGLIALALDRSRQVVCVGNSSSGIKETPVFGCPTVNIGSRQSGRLRGTNVIDTDYVRSEIHDAIMQSLFDPETRKRCFSTINPYWKGGAGEIIVEHLTKVSLDQRLLRKKMTIGGDGKIIGVNVE